MLRVLPARYEVEYEHLRLTLEDVTTGRYWYKRGPYDYMTWVASQRKLALPAHKLRADGRMVSPNGGYTICRIKIKGSENVRLEATAFCSVMDNFARQKGRNISLGRALKQLERDGEL